MAATEPPPPSGGRRRQRNVAFDYDRTVALSDGVFAIALTLLVLTIPEPDSGNDLWGFLDDNLAAFGAYGLSFVVLAALWRHHHVFLRGISRIDARLTSLNLLYLGLIALIPYPTGILAEHGDQSAAVVLYAATLAAVSAVTAAMVVYSQRAGLAPPRAQSLLWTLTTPAAFLVSIPIAVADPRAGLWSWLALLPLGVAEDRAAARAEAAGGG